jgi:hypothetical protein
MSSETHVAAFGLPVNEHARTAVALPTDTAFDSDVRYVPIVWDSTCGVDTSLPRIVGTECGTLPFFPQRRLISLLCKDRAKRTVGGALRVRRDSIRPEHYLREWRETLAAALTASQLAEQHGLCLRVSLAADLGPVRGARCSWRNAPFETFEDFEALYSKRLVEVASETGAPRIALSLDLRETDAARHAFYAEGLLTQQADAQAEIRLTVVPLGNWHPGHGLRSGPQPALFEEALS